MYIELEEMARVGEKLSRDIPMQSSNKKTEGRKIDAIKFEEQNDEEGALSF